MHAVLIWCNVGSCRRVSGAMGVAIVVCTVVMGVAVVGTCDGGKCVCVLRASGGMV